MTAIDQTKFKPVHDVGVKFGGVSIQDVTCRVGAIKIDRERMSLERADDLFANRRLIGRIVLGHADDAAGQIELFDGDIAVYGAFDVKGFRVTASEFGISLTFSRADIDVAQLSQFAKADGRLQISEVADIPEDEDLGPEHVPGSLKASGPWADVSLSTVFEGALLKSLKKAKLETVGDLANYTARDKRLTDIEGIGPGKAACIEDRMLAFWSDNPDAAKEAPVPQAAG